MVLMFKPNEFEQAGVVFVTDEMATGRQIGEKAKPLKMVFEVLAVANVVTVEVPVEPPSIIDINRLEDDSAVVA